MRIMYINKSRKGTGVRRIFARNEKSLLRLRGWERLMWTFAPPLLRVIMLFHFFIWMAENPPRADKSAPTDVQIHLSKCIIWLLRLAIASLGRMILQKMYANLRALAGIIKGLGTPNYDQ